MTVQCPHEKCGDDFSQLGNHWRWNPKHRPEITDRQHEILTGLLMGDAYISHNYKNPCFQTRMVSKKFLEWVDEEMGIMGNGVSFSRSAEESAKFARESGFNPIAKGEDYSDLYRWTSRAHPEFLQYSDWYSSGKKVFPDDLELTPLITKVWFCCDGNLNKNKSKSGKENKPSLRITCTNESDRIYSVFSLFEERGFYDAYIDEVEGRIVFRADESGRLWEWIGSPLPGFKYKWPN